MFYFIGLLIIILFVCSNINSQKRNTGLRKHPLTAEKLFLIAMCLTLFLILAMQSEKSNGDLINYMNAFNRYKNYSVSGFIHRFTDIKDPIYHLCGVIVSKLGVSFYGWHMLLSFIYVLSLYLLILHFSSNIYVSFIVLISVGNFGFAFSGMRQTLALAFLMFSFRYLEEKRLVKFLIFVVIASSFHSTAFIFIIAYPLYRMKLRIRNLLFIAAGGVFVVLNARPLMRIYLELTGTEDIYSGYLEKSNSLTVSGIIILGFITAFCVVFLMNEAGDAKYKGLCNLALVSLVFRILSVITIAEFFRISMYFSVFDIIMIAEACACDRNNNSLVHIKTLGATLSLTLYYFVSPSGAFLSYVMR